MIKKGLILTFLLPVFVAYGEDYIKSQSTSNEKYTKDVLIFGVTPVGNQEKMIAKYKPFLNYLSKKIGKKINFVISSDYNSLAEDVNKGLIHIASFSPAAYVKAIDNSKNIQYLCTGLDKKTRKDYYLGYIIVRKDTKINSYKDLKNKKFAFVDEGSASGYKYPVVLMKKIWGIDPKKYFKKSLFLGNHHNVIDAVYNKQVEAGATWEGALSEKIKEYKENPFKVLLQTQPIPTDAIAVYKKLDPNLIEKLKKEILLINEKTVDEEGNKVLSDDFDFTGFTLRDNKFYDIVREMLREFK